MPLIAAAGLLMAAKGLLALVVIAWVGHYGVDHGMGVSLWEDWNAGLTVLPSFFSPPEVLPVQVAQPVTVNETLAMPTVDVLELPLNELPASNTSTVEGGKNGEGMQPVWVRFPVMSAMASLIQLLLSLAYAILAAFIAALMLFLPPWVVAAKTAWVSSQSSATRASAPIVPRSEEMPWTAILQRMIDFQSSLKYREHELVMTMGLVQRKNKTLHRMVRSLRQSQEKAINAIVDRHLGEISKLNSQISSLHVEQKESWLSLRGEVQNGSLATEDLHREIREVTAGRNAAVAEASVVKERALGLEAQVESLQLNVKTVSEEYETKLARLQEECSQLKTAKQGSDKKASEYLQILRSQDALLKEKGSAGAAPVSKAPTRPVSTALAGPKLPTGPANVAGGSGQWWKTGPSVPAGPKGKGQVNYPPNHPRGERPPIAKPPTGEGQEDSQGSKGS